MNVYDFVLGFLFASNLALVGAGVYAFWRYAYSPFKVVRMDQKALAARQDEQAEKHNQLVDAFKKSQGLDRPRAFTDGELSELEADHNRRMVWR